MTPEEMAARITELEQQVTDLTAAAAGEPARTAAAVAQATATMTATIDQRAGYAAGLEAQLSEAQGQAAALQQQLSAALSRAAELEQYAPPTGSVITPAEFKNRLAPAYLKLFSLSGDLQAKWSRILSAYVEQNSFQAIYLTDPYLIGMMYYAVVDGLLTQAEADAVTAHAG